MRFKPKCLVDGKKIEGDCYAVGGKFMCETHKFNLKGK